MENVNTGRWKVSKHANLWAKNAFIEWRVYCGYDTNKSIIDLFENKDYVKTLVNMLSFFCFASCKKNGSFHTPNRYLFLSIFWIFSHNLFLQRGLGLGFRFSFMSFKFYIIVVVFMFCAFVIIVLWLCNGFTFYVFLVGFFVASSFWYTVLEDL
jgi:hypothetical protein